MKKYLNNKSDGFTLMEILVVMVIIGILVSIGINTFISSQQKGRDSRRKEDLHQITTALELYYNDHGQFPLSSGGEIVCVEPATICDWGTIFSDGNNTYMVQLPQDPVEGRDYYYDSDDGTEYALFTLLENEQDGDLVVDDDTGDIETYTGTDCGDTTECNYGIGSTNKNMPNPATD